MNKSDNLRGTNIKYSPYAFTEQGIYMLMTVLRGELAIKQSIAIIRTFKAMKDQLIKIDSLLFEPNYSKLVDRVLKTESDILILKGKQQIIDDQILDIINKFDNYHPLDHFLILNGERIEADLAHQSIYKTAKESLIIVDDYIGIKSLQLIKVADNHIPITIILDNKAQDGLTQEMINDFVMDTKRDITFIKNNNQFHDRYIVIDFKDIYLCGSSSKDSGSKITTIIKIKDKDNYLKIFAKYK